MGKKANQNVMLSIEITEHPKFKSLTETRKLSSVINELLYSYLNMSREDNKDIKKLENQLTKHEAKKDEIIEQIKNLKEEEKKKIAQRKLEEQETDKIADGIKMSGMMRRL